MPGKNSEKKPNQDGDFSFEDIIDNDHQSGGFGGSAAEKLKQVKAELKVCLKEKQENLAGWQRTRADYVNLKNEFEKRQAEYIKRGSVKVLGDLLPVIDSFQMAFANKEAWEQTPEDWRRGIEHIYNQFENVIKDHGLTKIEALNQMFDPMSHESIEAVPVDDPKQDHLVMEVIKDGYVFNKRVIRPAQVKIGIYQAK